MAFYENQSDMFLKRAESCKKHGDQLYAQAMAAKERGEEKKYQEYLVQAKNQYRMQEENEKKQKSTKEKTGRTTSG